ncbi:MAG: 2-succinyl-5-enolpyruvyl-6-hydroxy-3-cyclohexene-1-carboxylic-acid synthase [Muribaculaceae bacterium]|nr:2-succinyl-5-enolpyruvyl-6-hydroxy-3-cyclohexene-1-carboxylic-acid synthase [Muribaculaceae bacterium]
MITTDKWQCREVINLLVAYGVKRVVLSPGTRNTPLIMAAVRHPGLQTYSVIDERSAGFIACGMCRQSGSPVAVICTSGSAALNLTPAISEAYYSHLPVIAVTADRPAEWIDRDDSQTIRQPRLMQDITVAQTSVTCHCGSQDVRDAIRRDLNVTLAKAVECQHGPAHINVEIDEPISAEVDLTDVEALSCRKINFHFNNSLSLTDLSEVVNELGSAKRIMVVAGFDSGFTAGQKRMITDFAKRDNVTLLAEPLSDINCDCAVTMIDEVMMLINSRETAYYPDIVITLGGSLVSRPLKEFLRKTKARHWMVGHHDAYPDCFGRLSDIFPETEAFISLLSSVGKVDSDYHAIWNSVRLNARELRKEFMNRNDWCGLTAVDNILRKMPVDWHLQLSNGMAVRYAMGYPMLRAASVSCNRGVSGIDGSFSTAVGGNAVASGNSLFITGDMSAQYDMGAIASGLIDSRFRVVVMMNGGGEIFRVIKTTRKLPELDSYVAAHVNFPARRLAEAFGFTYVEAFDSQQLEAALPILYGKSEKPVMLAVFVDSNTSAKLYRDYLRLFRETD